VWNQSPTFWYLTLNAHRYATVQSLSRAYDQNQSSLHLLSWLRFIQSNLHLFGTEKFKKRLAGSPFVDSLAQHPRAPDPEVLANDITRCSIKDEKVKLLMQHRGNVVAHRNARTTASGRSLAEEFAVSVEDLEELLDRAHEIVNRYSSLFAATTYSRQMIGHDDYRHIFTCVRDAAEQWRQPRPRDA
jgi:hypothetical protein